MTDGISYGPDFVAEAEALMAAGQSAAASALLTKRIEEGRGGVLARECLVRALLAQGMKDRALEEARDLASLNPSIALANIALGDALRASAILPAAIAEYQRALRLDPEADRARLGLGLSWLDAGEAEKALEAFSLIRRAYAAGLNEAIGRATEMGAQKRSPAGYVRHLFDQFSASYDERMLGQLGYRAPQILRELVAMIAPERRNLVVLDLGCGTGLSGLAFCDIASRLEGIDLSPRMVAAARARAIYHEVRVGEVEDGFARRYDLIVAADTLVYLGDLDGVFMHAAGALAEGGLFVFTVERKEGEGFELGPKRRWRHSESYLRALAARHGFQIEGLLECTPRHEVGEPVPGLAVALGA